MGETITTSIQDYLKAIYSLTAEGNEATTSLLALRLGVAPASVTGMLQRMAAIQPPLVIYRKHQGVSLTPEGVRAALEVIRHHRLLETYLVENLGYTWDSVHEEACRLEHVISEDFEERIAASLGHPERDPHGAPIPSADLIMPHTHDAPLDSVESGGTAIIRRVGCQDQEMLQQLERLGLVPGVKLVVIETRSTDDDLHLRVGQSSTIALNREISKHIFVEFIQGDNHD
ncbi:MAG: metal-dependent transcriptional regulator [Chloroflexota bacterium]